jgi:multiple sugar transport system permease protein
MSTATATRVQPSRISLSSPRRIGVRLLTNGLLLIIAGCFLLPMAWLVLASLDAKASLSVALPSQWSLSNFTKVMTPEQTLIPLWNSFVLSAASAVITVLFSVLAAYPLSRYSLRIKKPFLYGILFGTGLPVTAMMVPVYSLFVTLNLLDSLAGTIFFMAATSLPMAIWMTKNFMDEVPIGLEEAAWVDGASSMQTLQRIVVPLMRPGIAVVFIFVFIHAWGNFFVPFVLLLSPENSPAAVSIFNFFGQYGAVAYGQLAAFSLLYSIPVIVLYVIVQKFLGGSFAMAGAVKG